MRYMMIVKATRDSERGVMPDPKLMEEISRDGEALMKSGVMVLTGGLTPSSDGIRVKVSKGELTVVDGPFAETTELVGGFAIMELPSKAAARENGIAFMKKHLDFLGAGYTGELEIRALFEPGEHCGPL